MEMQSPNPKQIIHDMMIKQQHMEEKCKKMAERQEELENHLLESKKEIKELKKKENLEIKISKQTQKKWIQKKST